MSSNPLDVLRDRLYNEADTRLRTRIVERLDAIREQLPEGRTFTVPAGEYTLGQLIDKVETEVFRDRRDQNRAQYVAEFIRKVREFEGQ